MEITLKRADILSTNLTGRLSLELSCRGKRYPVGLRPLIRWDSAPFYDQTIRLQEVDSDRLQIGFHLSAKNNQQQFAITAEQLLEGLQEVPRQRVLQFQGSEVRIQVRYSARLISQVNQAQLPCLLEELRVKLQTAAEQDMQNQVFKLGPRMLDLNVAQTGQEGRRQDTGQAVAHKTNSIGVRVTNQDQTKIQAQQNRQEQEIQQPQQSCPVQSPSTVNKNLTALKQERLRHSKSKQEETEVRESVKLVGLEEEVSRLSKGGLWPLLVLLAGAVAAVLAAWSD